jgi:hypothetical protein
LGCVWEEVKKKGKENQQKRRKTSVGIRHPTPPASNTRLKYALQVQANHLKLLVIFVVFYLFSLLLCFFLLLLLCRAEMDLDDEFELDIVEEQEFPSIPISELRQHIDWLSQEVDNGQQTDGFTDEFNV